MDDRRFHDGDTDIHMDVKHRVPCAGDGQRRSAESIDERGADRAATGSDGVLQSSDSATEPVERGERERDQRDTAGDIPVADTDWDRSMDDGEEYGGFDHKCVGCDVELPCA